MINATVERLQDPSSQKYAFKIDQDSETIKINNQIFSWDALEGEQNYFQIIKNHKTYTAEVLEQDEISKEFIIKVNAKIYKVKLKDGLDLLLEKWKIGEDQSTTLKNLKAPMPGLILEIAAHKGQDIRKGDTLMVLEAMKMENTIKSTGSGKISKILVEPGESVDKDQVLMEF